MPNNKKNKSTLKRLRTSKKDQIRNKSRKTVLKTVEKKFRTAIQEADAAKANELMQDYFSKLDKTAKVGVIHPNKVANKKSQLAILLNGLNK
jgi:small subunit ribosomal protein S20